VCYHIIIKHQNLENGKGKSMIEQQTRITDEVRARIHAGIAKRAPAERQMQAFTTALRHYALNNAATVDEAITAGFVSIGLASAPEPEPVSAQPAPETVEQYLGSIACLPDREFQPDVSITNVNGVVRIEFRPADIPWQSFTVAGDKLTPIAEI
jgi:hypothetical protein